MSVEEAELIKRVFDDETAWENLMADISSPAIAAERLVIRSRIERHKSGGSEVLQSRIDAAAAGVDGAESDC